MDGRAKDIAGVACKCVAAVEASLDEQRIESIHREVLATGQDFAEVRVIERTVVDVLAGIGFVVAGCSK